LFVNWCPRPAQVCNLGCAAVFLQFWNDCAALLGANKALYANTVAACQATESSAPAPAGR